MGYRELCFLMLKPHKSKQRANNQFLHIISESQLEKEASWWFWLYHRTLGASWKEKNRVIEERGGRKRDGGTEGATKKEGKSWEATCQKGGPPMIVAALPPLSSLYPSSLPPVSPAPRSPSAASACEPPRGRRSHSGSPHSSSPSR